MSESQSGSRSRLELARDEVDRVFGAGTALARAGRSLLSREESKCQNRNRECGPVRGQR
jgi:hypothetical protein